MLTRHWQCFLSSLSYVDYFPFYFNEKSQANGPYFESAVRVMARTCCEAEQSRNYNLLVRRMVLLIRLYIDITYLLFLTILIFYLYVTNVSTCPFVIPS